MRKRLILNSVILSLVYCGLFFSCAEDIDISQVKNSEQAAIGQPIEFDFSFNKVGAQTRSTTPLPVDETVYVTPNQGTTYYRYKYDESEERWKCIETNPLTWTATKMKLWAFVGNNGTSAPTITADQATNGYEDSDFLGSYGEYSFTSGVVKMTLEHKVARLLVKVTGSIDPSVLSCTTNSSFNTSANIVLGDAAISLTAAGTTESFKLYRSSFTKDDENAANNTTNFTAYMLPDDNFKTVFTLKCGGTMTYLSPEISVPLKAGQTSQVNIALPVIQKVTDFYPANKDQTNYQYNTGTAQEFKAPITGWYKLEVWGAQGGNYDYETLGWSDYDLQWKGVSLCKGGTGAYVTGKIKLKKFDKLYVYVGRGGIGKMADAKVHSGTLYCLDGGWNGGGSVVMDYSKTVTISRTQDTNATGNRQYGGGGAGGATDIALQSADWKTDNHLYSRIIVAGGGGGGCYTPDQAGWYDGGGGGGGSTWAGEDGDGDLPYRGLGGTLTYTPANRGASEGIAADGGFGFGGSCQWKGESMGGGGGGWYGGASGTGGGLNSAGGGGSSYAYTTELYYPGTSQTIASYYPTTYEGQDSYMPNTDYLLEEVSSISGSYVKTVAEDKYSKSTIEGARNAAWGVHGHARITILLE